MRGPLAQARARQAAQENRRAREIMGLFLRQGHRKPYVAEQTTRLLSGRVQESQIIVKHGGPGRERMEFLSPPGMQGEIILQNGGRLFHYKPSQNLIYEGVAPLEAFEARAREFMEDVKAGRIGVRVVGSQIVAGQNATIVEVRGGNGGKRLWIDDKTGVRVRTEELDAQGSVLQTSYFTKIDYDAVIDPRQFRPDSLPKARHEALFPAGPPLSSVQAAQQQVGYTLREPALPSGFRLSGAWVADMPGARRITILRYTDGAVTFALFQQPLPPKALERPGGAPGRVHHLTGVTHWTGSGMVYTLIGNLRSDTVQQIVASLR